VAVFRRTSFALFASGSVILDTLGIGGVNLDLTWKTSSTGDTGLVSELEALVATFALRSGWAGASLARGVALTAGLGSDFLDISFVILNLSGGGSSNFVHTPTAGGALSFVFTALLTVRLALVTGVGFLIVVESHSLFVGWALFHAHTGELSNFLGLAFKIGSLGSIGLVVFGNSSTLVPDIVHNFIVGHIGGFLVGLNGGVFVHIGESGSLRGRNLLFGENSGSWLGLHGFNHLEVHGQKVRTHWWLIDHVEHLFSVFINDTHVSLVGSEDGITFASEATSLSTVNTFTTREVAWLASTVSVGVVAWDTDSTFSGSRAHSALSDGTSLTGRGTNVPVGTRSTEGAFSSLFAEKTSTGALLTVTVGVSEVLGVTDVTFVDIICTLSIDLGRLTVSDIEVVGTDLGTSGTVLGKSHWRFASEALGLRADSALSMETSARFTDHSVLVLSGSVGNQRELGFALGATLVGVTGTSSTAVHVTGSASSTDESTSSHVFPMSGFASFARVTWAESTVSSGTGSTSNGCWVVTNTWGSLEVFAGGALKALVNTTIDLALGTVSDSGSHLVGGGSTVD